MNTIIGIIFLLLAVALLVDWVRADTFTGLPSRLQHRH